jgi:regulator of replication initiation timing
MEHEATEDQVKKLAVRIEEVQTELAPLQAELSRIIAEMNRLETELESMRIVKKYFENELAAKKEAV